jgi:SH3-like domain-containing protein
MNKILYLLAIFIISTTSKAIASEKLQVPRFVTIKASEANSRKGPGAQYPIAYVYNYKWLPVEIIAEYEQWRQIKDYNGDEGWIHSSILSGRRSIIITGKEPQLLYKSNNLHAKIVAKLMPNLVCSLNKCIKSWCKVKCQDHSGWVSRSVVWGVYEHEEW